MEELKEWQLFWQGVKPETAGRPPLMPADLPLLGSLKNLERRMRRRDRLKTAAVGLIILSMLLFLLGQGEISLLGGIGLGTVAAATLWFLSLYWRLQFRLPAKDLDLPAREFIPRALDRLQAARRLFQRHFPVYVLLLLVGLNLFYLGDLTDLPPGTRWLLHLTMTGALLAAAAWGMRLRARRFQRENRPLIEELEAVGRELEPADTDE